MRALSIAHQADAGPGIFADVLPARGDEHDLWLRSETAEPPGDPREYDAVLVFGGAMHADQEERHPWLREEKALLRDLLDRQVPVLGVCLGSQLLAEAAGGSARRAIRPEIGWHDVELTAEGATDPVLGALAPRFHGVPVAQLRVHVAARRHRARAQRRLPAGIPRSATQWASSSTPRCQPPTRRRGSTTTETTRTPFGSVSTRVLCGGRTHESIDAWNDVGRALCARFLDAANGST